MSYDDIVIRVTNLSKYYEIYAQPSDRLKEFVLPRLRRIAKRPSKQHFREFWALRDVSFEIKKGETVGIIGKNGSGKSTLLQMICGTLSPTGGNIQTIGRIAALLELGSGFNPEFTGRENVFLNASVMGLSNAEINARYSEIVAFADIGDFVEQPVKTYSSGMMVRLAFAVAIHVDPQILIVDEALSVGDLAFQNKCMAHIRKMSERGTTILFVTHDLSTTQLICDRVVWLQNGQVASIGDPVQICRSYYIASLGKEPDSDQFEKIIAQQETGLARFRELSVVSWSTGQAPLFKVGDRVTIRFVLEALADVESTVYGLSIYRSDGDYLIGQTSREAGIMWPPARKGEMVSGEIVLDSLALAPGEYRMALAAYSQDLAICYGMTGILPGFSVHADYPTWGKIIHPCKWVVLEK